MPVQPVVVHYPHRYVDMAWVEAGPPLQAIVRALLCRPINYVEITWLPPYEPSADEVADPALFANNVRRVMASALGVPVTGHTLDDVALQREARQLHLPEDTAVVEMENLSALFNGAVDRAAVAGVLADFARIDKEHRGFLTLEQWLAPVGEGDDDLASAHARPELENIFRLLDVNESGRLEFKEYLLTVLLLKAGASVDCGKHRKDAVKFAWDAVSGQAGAVAFEHVRRLVCMPATEDGLGEAKACELFCEVDTNEDGRIDLAEFSAHVCAHPELLLVFCQRMLVRAPECSPANEEERGPASELDAKRVSQEEAAPFAATLKGKEIKGSEVGIM